MSISAFKGYARSQRLQATEESFAMGMAYTEAPLKEGYLKELVNFNIDSTGELIRPRPGLQAYSEASSDTSMLYDGNAQILTGRVCSEANAVQHGQIITGLVSDALIPGTDLYKGVIAVNTLDATSDVSKFDTSLEHYALKQSVTLADTTDAWCMFKKPKQANAHGIKLEDASNLARHVGTYAFNNAYYYFIDGAAFTRGLYKTEFDTTAGQYISTKLAPKGLTPKEAVTWGYNMYSDKPYDFVCKVSTVGAVQLLGILPYDTAGELVTTPRTNASYTFKCFYEAPTNTKYKIVWEAKSLVETAWNPVKILDNYVFGTALNDNAAPLSIDYSAAVANTLIRVTCTSYTAANVLNTVPEQVMVVSFNLNPADYNDVANSKQVTYDLYKCSGMTYWRNRLVCYGFSEDPTVMLMSDVNDPTYFPYPNSADVFDEPIVYALPFLDKLLVFTATKIYQLVLYSDGLTWTKTELQRNLVINDWDIHLTKVIKNMAFFKSGNYFFMIVPKSASLTGELVLAPITKSIQSYFDHFERSITNTLKETYGFTGTFTLVHYYNYLDYEDVHNVYVFKTLKGSYINVGILYSTVSRSWRLYVYESQNVLVPYTQDATQKGVMMSLFSNTVGATKRQAFQFLGYSPDSMVDKYVNNVENLLQGASEIKNYQFLDTGFRDNNVQLKKRYREFQFNINNIDLQKLQFYTGFLIDGEERKEYNRYTVRHIVEPTDPNYGTLILERELLNPVGTPSNTLLADSTLATTGLQVYNDFDHWLLDESVFPTIPLWKIRIPVSGKGYAPRVKLISCNEANFELLDIAWVYRTLYSR